MRSILIEVSKDDGRLAFDGIRVAARHWILDTRKVSVRVRGRSELAKALNSRLAEEKKFAVWFGEMQTFPDVTMARSWRLLGNREAVPVAYEGTYKERSVAGRLRAFVVLKPSNRSAWRAVLGMTYFTMFREAGLHFESPLPVGRGSERSVMHALRLVTQRGALCGFLKPCRPRCSMTELRVEERS